LANTSKLCRTEWKNVYQQFWSISIDFFKMLVSLLLIWCVCTKFVMFHSWLNRIRSTMVKWISIFSISARKYIRNIRLPTYLTELRRVVHNLNSCQLHFKKSGLSQSFSQNKGSCHYICILKFLKTLICF
jgi:hypothetical protein